MPNQPAEPRSRTATIAIELAARLRQRLAAMAAAAIGPQRQPALSASEEDAARTQAAWMPILDALPAAAIAVDRSGGIVHHNGAATELFPKIKTGLPITHLSRHPDFMDALERISSANEPIVVEVVERVPVERRFFATLTRIAGGDGLHGLPQMLITFRDYSEQDKLVQMRADFIANASHELRTPLASLRGFVETLQGPARDDPQARDRFLGIMATQAARMTRLIDDLLSLSRAEMRVHLAPRGIVELNESCAFVVQTLEPLAEGAQIAVALHKTPSPALIRGEREEVVQVLQNLLQNALKYGHEGGHVDVRITREPGIGQARERIVVAIADDGPGIGPEHLPRLTERFYRASVASSREKGGTGLGLAIVKHIVNRHRGELRIQSRLGVGSTFSVVFEALASDRRGEPDANDKTSAFSVHKAVTKG